MDRRLSVLAAYQLRNPVPQWDFQRHQVRIGAWSCGTAGRRVKFRVRHLGVLKKWTMLERPTSPRLFKIAQVRKFNRDRRVGAAWRGAGFFGGHGLRNFEGLPYLLAPLYILANLLFDDLAAGIARERCCAEDDILRDLEIREVCAGKG